MSDEINTTNTNESDSFDDVNTEVDTSDSWDDEVEVKEEVKPKAEEKPKDRYLTATVNGKQVRVTEAQLLAHYQKQSAAEEKFQQASQIAKRTESFLQALQENPAAILNDPRLPIDRQNLAIQWLKQQVEEELADPKDLEAKELKRRLKEYEDRDLSVKQQAEQEEQQRVHQAAVQKIQGQLSDTFSKAMELSPLSKDPETSAYALREMAIEYRLARRAGYEATPEELAQKVQDRYFKSLYSASSSLSGEDLVNFLGKDILKKIRLYDLEQLRGPSKEEKSSSDSWAQEPRQRSKEAPKTIDPGDFRQKLREQY